MPSHPERTPPIQLLTAAVAHRTRCDKGLHLAIEMGGSHGSIELIQGMASNDVAASLRLLAEQIDNHMMNAHGHAPLANQAVLEAFNAAS